MRRKNEYVATLTIYGKNSGTNLQKIDTTTNIQPTVNRKIKNSHTNRKVEVIQTRLRLGKARLNHYLKVINQHTDGLCHTCKVPETIEHYILHCQQNKDMTMKIKTIMTKQRSEHNIRNILLNEEAMQLIAQRIADAKRKL